MPAQQIKPTRIELIRTNRRIRLAKRGLDLLKMKRNALVMEFFNISRTIRGLRENLRDDVGRAIASVREAELINGAMEIERVAQMSANFNVGVGAKNVMGVRVPQVSFKAGTTVLTPLYRATSVPSAVNDAIKQFEKVFSSMIEIAEKENAMRRLLQEIDKTKRRSNAIENMLIPQLSAAAKMIRMRLDEIERDTFTTLKVIKKKLVMREETAEAA
ncbi:MAG: V-type ATP synthase subunit D [Candidatus Thermoplasmatota archaeon]|nr:V-type ATP synthase subunit D [Candidatus Sysuiplasma jiujiangense]MBX8638970.1 V-type ATP synthase subunit D [Candidatus Sysuiplasma jiujiangense]MBX8640970.1 V-type ATP synthase subunit D [Candidatus Sysuiplasma jiujiangense]MCL5253982.1 V-type ATP synthase subunit D [Candidatus Thermoplasmatota archaeon]